MVLDFIGNLFSAGFYLIGLALKICGYIAAPILIALIWMYMMYVA